MKKKIFAVLLLSVFVFGVPGRADAWGPKSDLIGDIYNYIGRTYGDTVKFMSMGASSAISGGIGIGSIAGISKGLGKLAAKTLTHRSPLLPFVRR